MIKPGWNFAGDNPLGQPSQSAADVAGGVVGDATPEVCLIGDADVCGLGYNVERSASLVDALDVFVVE